MTGQWGCWPVVVCLENLEWSSSLAILSHVVRNRGAHARPCVCWGVCSNKRLDPFRSRSFTDSRKGIVVEPFTNRSGKESVCVSVRRALSRGFQ